MPRGRKKSAPATEESGLNTQTSPPAVERKPPEPEPPKPAPKPAPQVRMRVLRDCTFMKNGFVFQLRADSILTSGAYDLAELVKQGVPLVTEA